MIITRQKNVPWLWVASAHLPWAAMLFASAANTVVFTLEIRKFTANPAAIASLMAFSGFLTMFTGPLVNWLSDRLWTKWGRRKIFYVPAVCAQAILILFVPFAPNLWVLGIIYFLQFVALSFKAPNEALNQEIIPNHQRGRAAVFNKIYVQFGLMAYNLALIGRFDDILPNTPLQRFFGSITGEMLIFVVFTLALLSVVLLIGLGVKELRPKVMRDMRAELGGKISAWRICKKLFLDVFSSEWWPLYLLALSQAMYGVKLGGMVALMYTDQWGYSTQVLGYTQGIAQLVSIFIVMLVFPIADKFDKLKFYLVCVWLGLIGKLIWYLYVMLLVPDNRPSVWEIILIGEGINILGQLAGIISYPLVYEFIPLNKLGTASAGLGLFRGFIGLVMGPMMGVWLLYYSNIFMPGAGSEVLVVFSQPATEQRMDVVDADLEKRFGREIWIEPYKPFGTKSDDSRQWSIRVRDEEAEKLQTSIEEIETQIVDIQRQIDDSRIKGVELPAEIPAQKASLLGELENLKSVQRGLAETFRDFLATELADSLASADAGLLAATSVESAVRIEGMTAFPISEERAGEIADQVRLKLGLDEGAVRVSVDPAREGWFSAEAVLNVADLGDTAKLDAQIDARLVALVAGGDPARLPEFRALTDAVTEVIGGDRNALLRPFPDSSYKPHKTDYFSSYLLMAGTDVFAILIVMYLIRAEKSGRIQRRGKIEDEQSSGHGTAATGKGGDKA